jgi:MFS family permease
MPPLTGSFAGLGIFLAMAVITIGEAITAPAATALISRTAPATEQGAVLGVAQSASAGSRVLGPLVGAQLLAGIGPFAIFYGCAIIFVVTFAIATSLPRPPLATLVAERGGTRSPHSP